MSISEPVAGAGDADAARLAGLAYTVILLIAVMASIQAYEAARNSPTGLPPAQIFIDATGRTIGPFLLFICAVAQFFCGMASVTANSRMSYAFSPGRCAAGIAAAGPG